MRFTDTPCIFLHDDTEGVLLQPFFPGWATTAVITSAKFFCFDNKVKSEEADRTFQWLLVSRLTYCIFQMLVIATRSLWSLSSEVIFLITERHGAIKLMLSLRTRRVEVKRFWEMSDLCTQSCPGCPLPPPACSCAVKLSENHFHDWTQ